MIRLFLAITCLGSAFKDSFASNRYCCGGACVPSTVAFLVAALEPAVMSCKRATCPSRIAAAFLTAYCTTDNFNVFNPFDERTLAVVRGANLGCTEIWCGIGISAGVLLLTFLEQKIHFSYTCDGLYSVGLF